MKKNFNLVKAVLIISICVFLSLPLRGQIDENFRKNQKKAYVASSIAECRTSLKFCKDVLKVVPNHPVINYLAARLNALLGNEDIALKHLKKATILGYTTKSPLLKTHHLNDPAFSKIKCKDGFSQIINALKIYEKPIHNSKIAFTIKDKKLETEGITYDPIEKMFYLGSQSKHKIIKVDHFGNSIDFTQEGQDGLNIICGLHVDPIRRTLWACSYAPDNRSQIYKYNLSSGKLIKKYSFPQNEKKKYSFNDLVIHPNGNIYISGGGSIYWISHFSDKLEYFLENNSIVSPNGITLSDDCRFIYFADYFIGIYRIDIKTKKIKLLSHCANFSSFAVDGLYFKEKKLYAIQTRLNQISRFTLNNKANKIEKCEIFERYTPELIFPTTGVFVNDFFYYVTDDWGEGENPRGVIVMKVALK